jgi:broad specificity phosphatase PhoE
MVRFLIVRHGFSLSNKDGTFTGQLDIGLSEEGKMQAKSVCEYLLKNYKIDAVYSSDLSRAVDTVKGVADALNIPVIKEKGLREFYCGKWEGLTVKQVEELYPEDLKKWRDKSAGEKVGPTGGETRAELRDRAISALEKIAKTSDGKTVVVATHGGTIKMMQMRWEDPKNLTADGAWATNASTSVVEYENGRFLLVVNGFDEYLGKTKTEMPKGI